MSPFRSITRRRFLAVSGTSAAGLFIAFALPEKLFAKGSGPATGTMLNAFLRVAPDDSVTVIVNKSEMGQGVSTSLPMILAEELEADWTRIKFEFAPVAPEYNHTMFGMQLTGGSTSVMSSFDQLRRAGATARMMLMEAAARQWRTEVASCRASNGFVINGDKKLSYGELASRASELDVPKEVKLKDPKEFHIIGQRFHRLDTPQKTDGSAVFGIDVKVPGMLVAVVARPPVFGAKVKKFKSDKAKAVRGVRHVIEVQSGVAVVADGFWPAKKAREALEVEWDESSMASFGSDSQRKEFADLVSKPGAVARAQGDLQAAMNSAATKLEAVYEFPYLAHATMEPLNCVASVSPDHCEVWTGTQFQSGDRDAAAQTSGLKPEQVILHTTMLGGGFGRRAVPSGHIVREAVEISKKISTPVKVIWTREDDMAGGYYRPSYSHRVSAGLDTSGNPLYWSQTIVGQSILTGTPFESMLVKNGVDETTVEGAADLAYDIPTRRVDTHIAKAGVPVLWWRSVGHSHTAFVVETFIDEMAHAAGKDPLDFRLALLRDPRQQTVLQTAAEKAGWKSAPPPGRARGIAAHHSFGSYIAHVAEVSVTKERSVRVHRVVTAIDCGQVVNPFIIEAQMHSAVIFGMSAALHQQITFKNGRVQQSNFDDYPLVRMEESPAIEVHIVPGRGPQGGVGEPGVPPIAPAVMNAVFAATGIRIRRLPLVGRLQTQG